MQAALFNPNKLAIEYPESAITKPFPFNAYYSEAEAPRVDAATYKLELGGLIRDKARRFSSPTSTRVVTGKSRVTTGSAARNRSRSRFLGGQQASEQGGGGAPYLGARAGMADMAHSGRGRSVCRLGLIRLAEIEAAGQRC